jgi:hypothetical protein
MYKAPLIAAAVSYLALASSPLQAQTTSPEDARAVQERLATNGIERTVDRWTTRGLEMRAIDVSDDYSSGDRVYLATDKLGGLQCVAYGVDSSGRMLPPILAMVRDGPMLWKLDMANSDGTIPDEGTLNGIIDRAGNEQLGVYQLIPENQAFLDECIFAAKRTLGLD